MLGGEITELKATLEFLLTVEVVLDKQLIEVEVEVDNS